MAKTMSKKLNPYSVNHGKLLHMSQTHFTAYSNTHIQISKKNSENNIS